MRRYEILLFDADNTLFDFTRADEIIAYGRQAMEKALKEKDLKKE